MLKIFDGLFSPFLIRASKQQVPKGATAKQAPPSKRSKLLVAARKARRTGATTHRQQKRARMQDLREKRTG